MARAIIFDLDNCISAANEPGPRLLESTFEAIRGVNNGNLSDGQLQAAFDDCWIHALDVVARKHGFTKEMLDAGWSELTRTTVSSKMYGYGDLEVLNHLTMDLFLVTSGFKMLQESKVDALGIRSRFREVMIDALDRPGRTSKETIFKDILTRYRYSPTEVLVVGDNPESELAAGKRLGITTVQTVRPGISPSDRADHQISNFHDLRRLVENG